MFRRIVLALSAAAALTFGASAFLTEAARPCPQPGCPVIGCPPCSALVCDPGHCRQHCELVPGCEP